MEYLSDKSSVARMDKNLEKISPFELKNRLIEMADESVKKMAHVMLNAGRGNPNWIATEAREAFFALGGFGIEECRRVMDMPEGIAGIPQKTGIAQRFEEYLKKHEGNAGTDLLKRTYNYMLMEHAADPDELVHEWTESIVGDQYPMPDRILKYTEILVQDYLNQEMCNGQPPQGKFDLFATEGGTAGMCYVFDSLEENFLLHKGDSIALMVPIFTPYIEIPELTRYDYDVLNIPASTLNEDYERLIEYLKVKNPPAILPIQIAYYAGLRIGEVCGLTWQDINLEEQCLTIKRSIRYDGTKHKNIIGPTKRKKVRIVDFGDTLTEILKTARKKQLKSRMQYGELYHRNFYKEAQDKNRVYYEYYHLDGTEEIPVDYKEISFVCLRPDGCLELPSTLSIACRSVAKRLDGFENFHFHQLRHTYTSNLLSNGAAPKDVQELLGHSDVSTTMNVYAHSTRKAKRNSARLLDKVAGND